MPAPNFPRDEIRETLTVGGFVQFIWDDVRRTVPAPNSWSVSVMPAGLTLDATNGYVSGTPTTPGVITSVITGEVFGSDGGADSFTVIWNIISGNTQDIPIVDGGPDFSVAVNGTINITPTCPTYPPPTSWTWIGLPTGCFFNTTTGVVTGAPTSTGDYTVQVKATNHYGPGPVDTVVIHVVDEAATHEGDVMSLADLYIELTSGVVSRTPNGANTTTPLFTHKFDDQKVFNIVFTRNGATVTMDLVSFKLALKVLEPETAVLTAGGTADATRWLGAGAGPTAAIRLYVHLSGDALKAALDEEETDAVTRLTTLAEFEWVENNNYTPTVGPATLRGSSLTWAYDIIRDLQ